jgi:hypothetical protein
MRTQFNHFIPIPVAVEHVQAVVTVANVLFLCAAARLVAFSPTGLNSFSAGASDTCCICKREPILAVIFVVANVHLRNAANDTLSNADNVRKPFRKSSASIDAVLAFNVVAPEYIWLVFLLTKDLCESIVAVGVPI